MILAPLAASEMVTATASLGAPRPAASSGVAEFGLTVMIGVPLVTVALTV